MPLMALLPGALHAQMSVEYEGTMTLNAGNSEFAPYYIASNHGGTLTQKYSTLLSGKLTLATDTTRRFAYGFGAEFWGGYASAVAYDHYDADHSQWGSRDLSPARFWVQQLYAEAKYRSVLLTVGQKQHQSIVVNDRLGSGDLTWSGNSRPEPGVSMGFVNFQPVPFTQGWVQIAGQIGYYASTGGKWLKSHFSRYSSFITTSQLFHYKNIYLRTNPCKRLVFTIGMQDGCQFSGKVKDYTDGTLTNIQKMKCDVGDFFRVFIPGSGGNNEGDKFYEGNHAGSWDLMLDYKHTPAVTLRAYYQSPWEDGSGIGKQNGFDGVWGLEMRRTGIAPVTGIVVEYTDFTNQSGPLHWAPGDVPGTKVTDSATGADDYYNNYTYNGYQTLGMSIGSPFIKSPLYNTNGYMRYTDNMMRGFHMGVSGYITSQFTYRVLGSWRKSWGTPFFPRVKPVEQTSLLAEVGFVSPKVPQLSFNLQAALDRGTLYGNNFGSLLSVSYHGNLTLK